MSSKKRNYHSSNGSKHTSSVKNYREFVGEEIRNLRNKNPKLDNREYMIMAAKEWHKYKKENGIVTGNDRYSVHKSSNYRSSNPRSSHGSSRSVSNLSKSGSKTSKTKSSKSGSKSKSNLSGSKRSLHSNSSRSSKSGSSKSSR